MGIFRSRKDIQFVKRVSREVIERVVGEKFTYYAISKELTRENIYGESKAKIFDPPIEMFGLIQWLDQEITTNQFGQDIIYNIEIHLQEQYLEAIEMVPIEGDYLDYNQQKFEITLVEKPTQIFGKAGQEIGFKLSCRSVRESTFKTIISGTIEHAARTRPDEPTRQDILFDDVKFPYSGSKND